MWPIESIGSEFQGKRRREPFSMSPHLTLEISFDKERPLLPSIHGFEFLHGGGGFSEVAMGPGRNLRPSRIGRGTHLRLPHRDEFRCQRDVFAALGVFSFIRKLRPVENGGDKARAWEIRAKDRTKQSLDGETHRESQAKQSGVLREILLCRCFFLKHLFFFRKSQSNSSALAEFSPAKRYLCIAIFVREVKLIPPPEVPPTAGEVYFRAINRENG